MGSTSGRQYQIIGAGLGAISSVFLAPDGLTGTRRALLAAGLAAIGALLGALVDWLGRRAEAEARKKFGS